MSKEGGKLRDEIKADILKFKEEWKQELKTSRESLERDLRNEIRELRNEQRTMSKGIQFADDTIEELKKELESERAKNNKLSSEVVALQAQCVELQSKNIDLETRVVNMEQYSRNKNIEIQGVEQTENENVVSILAKIGAAIREPIEESDIEACHRVPTRNPDKSNILVQFRSRAKRDVALKKAKKMRLKNSDIGLATPEPVYVNEHLCPSLKRLLGMAIRRKHEHAWKSVWAYNGKIFARKNDDADAIQITREADLAKICSEQSTNALEP